MIHPVWKPILLVVSAPSGAGKTTLCERLQAEFPSVVYSVSCTTRKPRVGEVHGKSYYFLSDEEFRRHVEAGNFLEHANVHGYLYGTLRQAVADALANQKDVLMDLDVQGADSVRACVRRAAPGDPLKSSYVDVFIAPPSMEDLQLRLFGRGQDEAEVISRRLQQAAAEMNRYREYQYLILNDRLEASYDALRAIFIAEHHRISGDEP
jgi:guanylate kinase